MMIIMMIMMIMMMMMMVVSPSRLRRVPTSPPSREQAANLGASRKGGKQGRQEKTEGESPGPSGLKWGDFERRGELERRRILSHSMNLKVERETKLESPFEKNTQS